MDKLASLLLAVFERSSQISEPTCLLFSNACKNAPKVNLTHRFPSGVGKDVFIITIIATGGVPRETDGTPCLIIVTIRTYALLTRVLRMHGI